MAHPMSRAKLSIKDQRAQAGHAAGPHALAEHKAPCRFGHLRFRAICRCAALFQVAFHDRPEKQGQRDNDDRTADRSGEEDADDRQRPELFLEN